MPNKPHKKPNYFRAERQVHPELKNYYHINHFRGLSDSNFFLLCVDTQTLDLLHSLKEPKYYARWKVEVNNRDERISSDEDKAFVDYVWGKLEEQLADVACLDEVTSVLKELVAIKKMELAAKTDGIIRDHYPDPARLDEFAAKVGVTVDDLPTSDLDTSWPELSRFDELGDNRKMIDEVPSVWISEGMVTSKSMADMYAETMYETPIEAPIGPIAPVWIGQANSMAKYFYKIDLALRHLQATFSRTGQVKLELPDEPHTFDILTGDRVSIRSLVRKYLPASFLTLWPLFTYANGGSVFTWGELKSNDPQKYDPDQAKPHTSYIGKSLHESLRSTSMEETTIVAGTGPILGNTPEIPATPISSAIPSIPYYAGTTDITWPAMFGMGIADMLKLPEKATTYESSVLGLPFGVKILNGKYFAFIGDNHYQMFPRPSTIPITFPKGDSLAKILDSALRVVKPTAEELASEDPDESNLAKVRDFAWNWVKGRFISEPLADKVNFIDIFTEVFKLADDDPNLKSADIKTHAQILNNQSFSLEGGDFNFNANLTGVESQLAAIVTKLGGVDKLQDVLERKIVDLINALEGKLGQSSDLSAIEAALKQIAQAVKEIEIINTNILNTGETASIAVDGSITGGKGTGSTNPSTGTGAQPAPLDQPLPNEQPIPSSDVCRWVEMIIDSIIGVYEWILWAVEWGISFFGATPVGKIVTYLLQNKSFIALLTGLGLLDPLPDEVVTLPVGTATLITAVVNIAVRLELAYLRLLIESLKLNKQILLGALCNYKYDATDLKDKINVFIESVVREFDDHKEEIRDLLQMVFENPDVMRKFLYQPAPQNLLQ